MKAFSLHRQSCRGVALIITLSTVALLTVLVTAFFIRSLLNREISSSDSSLVRADFVARSAADLLAGEVRNEIADPTDSTAYTSRPYYLPNKPLYAVPQASGLSSPTGVLVKVSANNVGFAPDSLLVGSSYSTATASANGRQLSASHWFSGSDSPQLGSNGTVPTWLFLTRQNGVKTPVVTDAKNPASGDYVIGRFAYCVYDVGSLLDANVAGYPAAAAANAPFKPSTAYADLSVLNWSAAASYVGWRNAASGADATTFQEWASGVPRTTGTPNTAVLTARRAGYRTAVLGDNATFSRRDLLHQPSVGTTAGSLTHFARSLNAPTPNASSATYTAGGTVTHYLDDGTVDPNPITVSSGDLLLQRRFSLAKLSWLTWQGPKAGVSPAAIQACFGLQWVASNQPGNQLGDQHWTYVGPTGNTTLGAIESLAQVALESTPREPNFFEMLKAGILPESLGRASLNRPMVTSDQQTREGVPDLQVLRIGANAIDEADADNLPTTIVLNVAGLDVPVYGVEDLPYLYGLTFGRISDDAFNAVTGMHTMTYCSLLMAPMLFNPHAPSAPTPGLTPSNIRIRIKGGSVGHVWCSPLGNAPLTPLAETLVGDDIDLTTRPSILIPASKFEAFRGVVTPIHGSNASSATQLGSFQPHMSADQTDVHGFNFYTYKDLPQSFTITTGGNMTDDMSNLLIVLEYQDPGGAWHIYDTLAGNEAFITQTGLEEWGSRTYLDFGPGFVNSKGRPESAIGYGSFKVDPRTTRFNAGLSSAYFASTDSSLLAAGTNLSQGFNSYLPFGSAVGGKAASFFLYPGIWAEGDKTDWNDANGSAICNVADNKNVTTNIATVRPSDGWLNGASTNPLRSALDMTRRPMILQQPFRTVGEMGYVFRDSPWKTLSFFDETSGDAALLDFFCLSDQSAVTAGQLALNSRVPASQQALLSQVGQSVDGTVPLPNASGLAAAYQGYAFSGTTPTATLPLDLGGFVKFMSSSSLSGVYPTSANPIKNRRESVVRALAGSSQSRTWNLLIDVVAQTGRYSPNAASLDQYVVEGQQRYWLSLAVDRYTGQIIDQQLEPANE